MDSPCFNSLTSADCSHRGNGIEENSQRRWRHACSSQVNLRSMYTVRSPGEFEMNIDARAIRCAILLSVGTCLVAASLPKSSPEEVGLSADRLKRVHALVERYIDKGEVAGAVSLVARRGRVAHFEAQGVMDLDTKKPMRTDVIFRLASMTKPVTSLAVMMLHEEGHFLLEDPLSKVLPEFKQPKVAIANAPNERETAGYRLVPAEREITIRQLLTHTAGLASGSGGPTLALVKSISRKPEDVLADHIRKLAELPLNFQPGAAWEYGPATDVLGRLVEAVSGKSLDAFFRERILGRLGMNDTWFYRPQDRIPRLATPI